MPHCRHHCLCDGVCSIDGGLISSRDRITKTDLQPAGQRWWRSHTLPRRGGHHDLKGDDIPPLGSFPRVRHEGTIVNMAHVGEPSWHLYNTWVTPAFSFKSSARVGGETPCCLISNVVPHSHAMEIASVGNLPQSHELRPIERDRMLHNPMNFISPIRRLNFGINAPLQHGEVTNLQLPGRQSVYGASHGKA